MSFKRGDVGLARFPHAGGGRGKKRPVVVVQADVYNLAQRHVIIAEVTGNLTVAGDPANLLIDVSTADGKATGMNRDSVVTCLFLVTITPDRIEKIISSLSATLMRKLDDCLKAALDLP